MDGVWPRMEGLCPGGRSAIRTAQQGQANVNQMIAHPSTTEGRTDGRVAVNAPLLATDSPVGRR